MVPGVRSPVANIAGRTGVYPVIDKCGGRARIFCVIPSAGPAIALHAKNHGLPIRQHLIYVHLNYCNGSGGIGQVDPPVVHEIPGGGVVPKE